MTKLPRAYKSHVDKQNRICTAPAIVRQLDDELLRLRDHVNTASYSGLDPIVSFADLAQLLRHYAEIAEAEAEHVHTYGYDGYCSCGHNGLI